MLTLRRRFWLAILCGWATLFLALPAGACDVMGQLVHRQLTPEQHEAASRLNDEVLDIIEEGDVFRLEAANPEHRRLAQWYIEGSTMTEAEKLRALAYLDRFARKNGNFILNGDGANYFCGFLFGEPVRQIELEDIRMLGSTVVVHELDHFDAIEKALEKSAQRHAISLDEALRRLKQMPAMRRGLESQWLERRALKAENDVTQPHYPHLEKMRRWAKDYNFLRRAKSPASPERRELVEAIKILVAETESPAPNTPQQALRNRDRNRVSLPSWNYPEDHWKSREELALLAEIKTIFKEDLLQWRQRRYSLAAHRAPPTEAEAHRYLRYQLSEPPELSRERMHFSHHNDFESTLSYFPKLGALARNESQRNVDEYLAALRAHLQTHTFPGATEPELTVAVARYAELGLPSAPDVGKRAGKGGEVDTVLFRLLGADPSNVPPAVKKKLAKSPQFSEYFEQRNFYQHFDELKFWHKQGVDIRPKFWESFEYYMRTRSQADTVKLARELDPQWQETALALHTKDLAGRQREDIDWCYGLSIRTYERNRNRWDKAGEYGRILKAAYEAAIKPH